MKWKYYYLVRFHTVVHMNAPSYCIRHYCPTMKQSLFKTSVMF